MIILLNIQICLLTLAVCLLLVRHHVDSEEIRRLFIIIVATVLIASLFVSLYGLIVNLAAVV